MQTESRAGHSEEWWIGSQITDLRWSSWKMSVQHPGTASSPTLKKTVTAQPLLELTPSFITSPIPEPEFTSLLWINIIQIFRKIGRNWSPTNSKDQPRQRLMRFYSLLTIHESIRLVRSLFKRVMGLWIVRQVAQTGVVANPGINVQG